MESRHFVPLTEICGAAVLRPVPLDKKAPAASRSPMVAERPILRGFTPASCDRRWIKHRVWPPRSPLHQRMDLVYNDKAQIGEELWNIKCLRISRASKDSGVIWRMPEGFFAIFPYGTGLHPHANARRGYRPPLQRSLSRINLVIDEGF